MRDISSYGALVETVDRWYPGVIMKAQLMIMPSAVVPGARIADAAVAEKAIVETAAVETAVVDHLPSNGGDRVEVMPSASIPLMVRIVRCVPEGICVEFMLGARRRHQELERFLLAVEQGNGSVKGLPAMEEEMQALKKRSNGWE